MFRVVVQDSRLTPTSGKVVANLGHYDPHTKSATVDTEKASFYLSNGAQPSDRVARLLQKEGVKLPDWVELSAGDRTRAIRNAEKLRSNQPEVTEEAPADTAEEAPAEPTEVPAEEAVASEAPAADEAAADEAPAEEVSEAPEEAKEDEEKKEA